MTPEQGFLSREYSHGLHVPPDKYPHKLKYEDCSCRTCGSWQLSAYLPLGKDFNCADGNCCGNGNAQLVVGAVAWLVRSERRAIGLGVTNE